MDTVKNILLFPFTLKIHWEWTKGLCNGERIVAVETRLRTHT